MLDAHEHLGGGADEVLGVAQVDEEAVGRGVALAQPPEDLVRVRVGVRVRVRGWLA